MDVGSWGLNDIKARVAQLQTDVAAMESIDVSAANDGIKKVGSELRLDIDALPTAPEN